MFHLYILHSPKHDKYYIGQTKNLEKRFYRHNSGNSKYTKPYRPWLLVYSKTYKTRSAAVQKERYLKSLKDKGEIINIIDCI